MNNLRSIIPVGLAMVAIVGALLWGNTLTIESENVIEQIEESSEENVQDLEQENDFSEYAQYRAEKVELDISGVKEGYSMGLLSVEKCQNDNQEYIKIGGWGIITGTDLDMQEPYIILKSDVGTYVYRFKSFSVPSYEEEFKGMGTNLDKAGFLGYIAKEDIPKGSYAIGVLLKNGQDMYYSMFNNENIIEID